MIPSKEQRDEWRRLAKDARISAVDEYIPEEFITLLDAVDELEQELEKLREKLK